VLESTLNVYPLRNNVDVDTGVDGHTVLRFVSDIYTDTILRFARSINSAAPTLWATNSPDPDKRDPDSFGDVDTTPHKIEWVLTPELATGIRFAETRLSDLILQNEVQVLEFTGYGKNFITSMSISPDAFVQMAFQAAYYGLYGRVEPTYEPAMTKAFLHGQTEAIFTVSKESADFVQTFWGDVSPAIKVNALKKACEKHVEITKRCGQGKGHHRHLYALFCIWERGLESGSSSPVQEVDGEDINGGTVADGSAVITVPDGSERAPSPGDSSRGDDLPGIYADVAWEKLGNIVLSTSNCGNPSLRLFGFGPVSADGSSVVTANSRIRTGIYHQRQRVVDLCFQ
jgi:carnitine O-acetyltransferase